MPVLRTILNKIIKSVAPAYLDIGPGKIIFNKNDPVMTAWVSFGSFEPQTVDLYKKSLREGMNVVDIGANIGYYTIIGGKMIGTNGKIFSYEPDEDNFYYLETNVRSNDLKNAHVLKLALSDSIGKRKLYLGDEKCTNHSFGDNSKTGKTELVETDTLDNNLKRFGSPKIDVIKIDIEGAEILAIEGMKETIARNPNIIILTEFYPKAIKRLGKSPVQYLRRLQTMGFNLLLIDEDNG